MFIYYYITHIYICKKAYYNTRNNRAQRNNAQQLDVYPLIMFLGLPLSVRFGNARPKKRITLPLYLLAIISRGVCPVVFLNIYEK